MIQGRQIDDGAPRPRSLLDEEETAVKTWRLRAGSTAPSEEGSEVPGLRRLP